MSLLSLNKGATRGYVNEDYWARYAEVDDALQIAEQTEV